MILGTDDHTDIKTGRVDVKVSGNNDAHHVLSLLGSDRIRWERVHLSPSYFRKPWRYDRTRYDVLWNMVTDADQNPELLTVIDRFTREMRVPVIDPAAAIKKTRRHMVSETLAGLSDVHTPRTLLLRNPTLERVRKQVADTGFQFPGIVRRTGAHNGQFLGLFDTPEAIEGVYGDRKREYYLTEYVDVRAPDGLFRKSRFYFVGREIIVRQHIVAPDWNIHGASTRDLMIHRPDLLDEGRAVLTGQFAGLSPVTKAALEAIRDRMGLDYFGLDACIRPDGSVVVFEANATMNFHPKFENPATQYNRAALEPMLAAIRTLIYEKNAQPATKT
jgi:hypothetical protein